MRKPVRLEDLYLSRVSSPGRLERPCEDQVLIEGLPAARLATPGVCGGDADLVKSGAAMVLIGGLPAARAGDATLGGGVAFGPGAAQVLLGGPTFSLPSVITIRGDADYQSKVLRDLYVLSTTRSGRALLTRLEDAGQPIVIGMPEGIPPANHTAPLDGTNWVEGRPCGATIYYNPDHSMVSRGPGGELIAISPQEALMHEAVHALGFAEGTEPAWREDPEAPEPGTSTAEARAIGYASHEGSFPSENSFREDLGLTPPRATHRKPLVTGPSQPPPPQNFRPGRP